jgi:hypothetical protein
LKITILTFSFSKTKGVCTRFIVARIQNAIRSFTRSGTAQVSIMLPITIFSKFEKYASKFFELNENLTKFIIEHYKTHTSEKPFKCYICNMVFAQKGSLFKHIKTRSKAGDDHGYTLFMQNYHGRNYNSKNLMK